MNGITCQMPKADNSGELCLHNFPTKIVLRENGIASVRVGDYVRHLIAAHWSLLVRMREAMDSGEIEKE